MTLLVFTICLLVIGVFFFYASYSIDSNIYLKTYCKKRTTKKIVALTFDDGPHPTQTPLILDILRKQNVQATFFCIGEKAEKHPELVKRIVEEGHLIGNHSYSHTGYFPLLRTTKMEEDIRKCTTILEQTTCKPIYLFRPPFGVTNPTIAKVIKKLNYKTIGWSIRSLDTRQEPVEKIFSRIINRLSPGDIILLHDRMPESADLLSQLLEYLQNKQYKIIRIDELFKF